MQSSQLGEPASASMQAGSAEATSHEAGLQGAEGSTTAISSLPRTNSTLEQLVQDQEAQISRLNKQLQHYRSWVSSVHARVLHMNPKAVQNAKRLYVGNLPQNVTMDELCQFMNELMAQTGAQVGQEPPVVQCHHTPERSFAFVEFRTVEEASNAMGLDGVPWKDTFLKIRRPSNYDLATSLMLGPVTPDPTMDTSCLNLAKQAPEESPNKLFVGGLPCEWPEQAVRKILEPWGEIKAFNLVMDKATGNSKGYAFCEYADDAVTDKAINGLNGQRAGSKTLTVKRAAEGARHLSTSGNTAALSGSTALRMRGSEGLDIEGTSDSRSLGAGGFGGPGGFKPAGAGAPGAATAYTMMPYASGRGPVGADAGMQRMAQYPATQPYAMPVHPGAMGSMVRAPPMGSMVMHMPAAYSPAAHPTAEFGGLGRPVGRVHSANRYGGVGHQGGRPQQGSSGWSRAGESVDGEGQL